MSGTVVARYSSIGEAETARSALDAAQIDVWLIDERMVGIDWLYSQAVGGVKVMVRDEDRESSEMVLATLSQTPATDDAIATETATVEVDEADTAAVCPACRSTDVKGVPRLAIFAALAIVLYGVGAAVEQPGLAGTAIVATGLILLFAPSRRCLSCGERWSAAEPAEASPEPQPPNPSDLVEATCPRCGSADFYFINYRRLKAIPLFTSVAMIVVLPLWLFLPKRQCERCGHKA